MRRVRQLASNYGFPVLVKRFDTAQYAEKNKCGIQEAARVLRYNWFNELVEDRETPCDYVLTAHHGDDNIETLLMNFLRGTGISGLHGILPKQGKLLRPMLFARKQDILGYARRKGLEYVEDSSNLSDKYTRNFVRHSLIPVLKEVYSNVEENLLQNIQRFQEIEWVYQERISQYRRQLLKELNGEIMIPVLLLQRIKPLHTVLFELIGRFGFKTAQIPEVAALLDSGSGKYVASSTHRIIRNRNWLVITSISNEVSRTITIEKTDSRIDFPDGSLNFTFDDNIPVSFSGNENEAWLDADRICFPLILRKWKPGDYFYPLGMKKKKKLSRFLIDKKLSVTAKEKVWVLEMNKKIIWIVNHRIDDRFRITPASRKVLNITYTPHT
jgi:tRNA(Ile)-lysidine synthase